MIGDRIDREARAMTDGEQTLALISGTLVMMWALRRGRLIPMLAMGFAGPLLASALRKRWPAELVEWSRNRTARLGPTGARLTPAPQSAPRAGSGRRCVPPHRRSQARPQCCSMWP